MRRSPAPCAAVRAPCARCSRAGATRCGPPSNTNTGALMQTTDTDVLERFAPLRELEPTDEEIASLLAAADELRAPRRRARPARAVALVAATAAVIGALAALPRGKDSAGPKDAHGILQAAAAVAAEQTAPSAYRYTRVLSALAPLVQADG